MKKIFAILLVFTFILGLGACAASGTTTTPSASAAASAAPSASAAASAAPSASAAASASAVPASKTGVLTIGSVLNTSGWFAPIDLENSYELQALVDIINKEGGVQIGDTLYTLKFVLQDGKSDPAAIRSACIAIADQNIKYVIESNDFWMTSGEDVFETAGIMHITGYDVGVPTYMNKDTPYAFTFTNGSFGDYISVLNLIKKLHPDVKKVVFVNADNGTNKGINEFIKASAAKIGITVVADPIMYAGDTTDFSSIALQVINSGADAYITSDTINVEGAILKELRAQGSKIVCASSSGFSAAQLSLIAGKDASTNAFTLGMSFDPANNTAEFMKVYNYIKDKYGDKVAANYSSYSCSCLWTLLDIMKKAGSIDVDTVKSTWEKGTSFDTFVGPGKVCGTATYGINHAIGRPTSYTYFDDKGNVVFGGWMDTYIP